MELTQPKQDLRARGDADAPGFRFAETSARALDSPRTPPEEDSEVSSLRWKSMETAARVTNHPSFPTTKGFPRKQDFQCPHQESFQADWEELVT